MEDLGSNALVQWQWARLFREKNYYIIFIAFVIIYVFCCPAVPYVYNIPKTYQIILVVIYLIIGIILIACEFTKVHKYILWKLVKLFEWQLIHLMMVAYCVIGWINSVEEFDKEPLSPFAFVSFYLYHFLIISLDSTSICPKYKLILLTASIINSGRVYATNMIKPNIISHTISILSLTLSTKDMMLSCLFQITLFSCKYLYFVYFEPDILLIFQNHVTRDEMHANINLPDTVSAVQLSSLSREYASPRTFPIRSL